MTRFSGIFRCRSESELTSSVGVDKVVKKIKSNAYYIAFALYVVWEWLRRTTLLAPFEETLPYDVAETLMQCVSLGLLAIVFLSRRTTPLAWAFSLGLLALGFIVWRTAGEGWLFWLAIFVACSDGVDLNRIARIVLIITIGILVVAVVLSTTGIIENIVSARAGGTIRVSMGYKHPNSFGAALIVACVAFSFVRFDRSPVISCLACLICAVVAWTIADSRSSALCLTVMCVMLPIFHMAQKQHLGRPLCIVLLVLFLLFVISSAWLMVNYDPASSLQSSLDSLLSGRLRLAHTYFLDHAPGLLGYGYEDGTEYWSLGERYTFVVDNMYSHVLLRYGILAWGVFVAAVAAFYLKAFREGYCGGALFGMAVFMAYGFAETLGCRIECNFLILSLVVLLNGEPLTSLTGRDRKNPENDGACSFWCFLKIPFAALRGIHG